MNAKLSSVIIIACLVSIIAELWIIADELNKLVEINLVNL
jgi:hypothetical protein